MTPELERAIEFFALISAPVVIMWLVVMARDYLNRW